MNRFATLTLSLTLLVVFAGAALGQNSFTESFTMTTYRDTLNTTAVWDTVSGELRLAPFAPSLVGTFDTPGLAQRVVVSGNRAYVSDGTSGLQVIDITDPANPSALGSYDTPGTAWGIAVAGNNAFVADDTGGLQVIDISDPANPTLAGKYDKSENAIRDVAVDGNHAFVADLELGLLVMDISDPIKPSLIGTYETPQFAYGVDVAGDFAYVADGTGGMIVFDISNPASPDSVGIYDTLGHMQSLTVVGDHAYCADGTSGLLIIDISTPATPTLVGTYDTPGVAISVRVSGNYAFVADFGSGLQKIDITDPTNPTLFATYDTPQNANGIAVAGNLVFVADDASGIQVIEMSAIIPPTQLANYNLSAQPFGAAVHGDYALVAADYIGLQVVDVSDPTNPTLTGTYNTPSSARDVAAVGDYAFVADYASGLQIVNISNPSTPALAGTFDTPGNARGIEVSGDYAFVADGTSGMLVIDISNPNNPTLAGSYDTPNNTRGVEVSGNYAFIADGVGGMQVIDISDPDNPTLAGTYNTPGDAMGVAVDGNYAFIADFTGSLQVLDISDPTNPTLAGIYNGAIYVTCVDVAGDYAFIGATPFAGYVGGFIALDISDPTTPIFVGADDRPGVLEGIALDGNHAFVADWGSQRLRVIQVFQEDVEVQNLNAGQSYAIDGGSDTIVSSRFESTETNGITWEMSADNGANWQPVAADNQWIHLAYPGDDFLWKNTLSWTAPGVNPSVSDVTFEWLYEHAQINSVSDFPNDQGKQVSLTWTRSGYDFVGASPQIVEYVIYRQIDSGLTGQSPIDKSKSFEGLSEIARENALLMQSLGWDYVVSVPVLTEDSYAVVVPTLADSTIVSGDYYSKFRVTALTATPGVLFHSYPDSGYSVDNLAPAIPTNVAVAYNTGNGNTLLWDEAPDADFQYFRVYRANDPNFTPSPANLAHSSGSAGWIDPDYDGDAVYYKVTSNDFSGNESEAASSGSVSSVQSETIPPAFALHQNAPNPFNPMTRISYNVARGGEHVTLRIYSVSGRLERTLIDGIKPEGEQSVMWDGRDDAGHPLATGTYFYRFVAPGFEQTKKMTLLK